MLFRSGALIGELSGALGPIVFSHNKGGTYARARVVPTKSTTSFAEAAKARLAEGSSRWQTLTDAQRAAWATWAQNNPVINRIGDPITLSGAAAYTGLAASLLQIGVTPADDPPVIPAPDPVETLTPTFDIGTGAFDIAFTATPLGADDGLYVQSAVVNSPGINHVSNLLKLTIIGDAATASPLDVEAVTITRFGTLQAGQKVSHFVSVFNRVNGQRSRPLRADGLIVDTV